MKYALILVGTAYVLIAVLVFIMHTQMPATFGLALLRSVLWPVWFAGGLQGTPIPMD